MARAAAREGRPGDRIAARTLTNTVEVGVAARRERKSIAPDAGPTGP